VRGVGGLQAIGPGGYSHSESIAHAKRGELPRRVLAFSAMLKYSGAQM
jgi:hypothetical protein